MRKRVGTEGQIFTPAWIVNLILDAVGYTGQRVLQAKIMEPAFGEGVFLYEILNRIIKAGECAGLTKEEIGTIISNSVYGIEKDVKLYTACKNGLTKYLSDRSIPVPSWDNLLCGDTLLLYKQYTNTMDFCIGNPPYIRIHDIKEEYRGVLKEFEFSDGMSDMYIVFYEAGLKMLKAGAGRLGYITPNAFMRTASAKNFRAFLTEEELLSALYDFKESQIFTAMTYTCICILDKDIDRGSKDCIEYREYNNKDLIYRTMLTSKVLKEDSWIFSNTADSFFLQENKRKARKLKDFIKVHTGIQTGCDKVYVGKAWYDKECKQEYRGKHTDTPCNVWFNGTEIESALLHRCIKASRYTGVLSNLYVLFPYKENTDLAEIKRVSNGTGVLTEYIIMTEQELQQYPKAYSYLYANKGVLETRDFECGKNKKWYGFSRSQGLKESCNSKMVFKNIIKKGETEQRINTYLVDSDVIIYGGKYITLDVSPYISIGGGYLFNDLAYELELHRICDIINSSEFYRYCTLVGTDKHGGYVSISGADIKNFGVE